ncbi:MAG: hypothetical protein Q7S49_01500 [bacterium]|nr:hypothetical protein [bacterium]
MDHRRKREGGRISLAWRKLWDQIDWWTAMQAVVLIVSFIALALWLERTTSEAIKQLTSIPRHYWWWGLGITSGVVLLAGLLKNAERRRQTVGVYRSRWLWWPVVILLFVAIGIGAYGYFPWSYYWEAVGIGGGLKSPSSSSGLPFEVVGPIIAGCESRGLQFNPDGSVVTNKNRNGTIDRGKWQINSSHDAEVKRLNIDIMTEEGNEKFARILYAKNELQDWEASRHCWEPKLLALGRSTPLPTTHPTTDTTFVVVVRPEQPAEVVMPPNWMIVWWGDKSRFTSHAIWRGPDKIRVFAVRPGVGSADIKIHRYHDPDPNWWRRQ